MLNRERYWLRIGKSCHALFRESVRVMVRWDGGAVVLTGHTWSVGAVRFLAGQQKSLRPVLTILPEFGTGNEICSAILASGYHGILCRSLHPQRNTVVLNVRQKLLME
jgi:hypothetical protein